MCDDRAAMPRPRTTPAEASRLIAALIERRFDGELPPLSTAATIFEASADLARLPLAETLPLHGRALFAAASLEPAAREQAAWARQDFLDELGAAVGVSARVLLAALRARSFPLAPPRPVAGYAYLGAFRSEGALEVADPCHLRKRTRLPAGVLSLSHPVEGHPGLWHAFVRDGRGEEADRTAELAVIHELGFEVAASEPIATIGVDAGMAGVFDRSCPEPALTEMRIEGVVHGLGAFAKSGFGDGVYPVFAGRAQGRVAKLRLAFLDERPELDATLLTRASRRYAATATFAVGDAIEHPKFGTGVVIGAADGKIEVQFEDEPRKLVHGRG